MAGQVAVLDTTYNVNDAAGVTLYTCVVQGANAHDCANAGAAGVGHFLGVAQETQSNGVVAVIRQMGNTWVKALGPINVGDALVIGNTSGYVDADYNQAGATEIIGYALEAATTNGDLILMVIAPTVKQLKKLTGVTNATANTASTFAHGLGYVPTKVILTSRGAGYVYEGAAADATNITVDGSISSLAFDAYVI